MTKFHLSEIFYGNAFRFATGQLFVIGIVTLLWVVQSPFIPASVGHLAVILLLINALASPYTAKLRSMPNAPSDALKCSYCNTPMIPTESECPQCHAKLTRPISEEAKSGID